MEKLLFIFTLLAMSCATKTTFTKDERTLVGSSADAGTMRVLTTDDPADSLQLRRSCEPLSAADLQTGTFAVLKARMLATVRDPQHEGIGIAAPQVGVIRQLIAVERHDLETPEFQFFVNPKIEQYSTRTAPGREGCLSIPGRSQEVVRSTSIVVSYLPEAGGERVQETIEGFTAVIFQHETDHLNGILYIDRATQ